VSPFVPDADVAYDARLVGTWSDSEGRESVVIVHEGNGYDISYNERGKIARFHGVLGRLGSRQVLDVVPDDLAEDHGTVYRSLLVPTHAIVILEVADNQLTICGPKPGAIKKLLKERPSLVGHLVIPGDHFGPESEGVVLTAPTADVRKFLSEIIDRPGVLGEPESWHRK